MNVNRWEEGKGVHDRGGNLTLFATFQDKRCCVLWCYSTIFIANILTKLKISSSWETFSVSKEIDDEVNIFRGSAFSKQNIKAWLASLSCESDPNAYILVTRGRSFWSTPRIATSGPAQRHSGFEWLCKHNRLRPEPIRLVKLDSEHAQSDGGLPVLDLARGRDSWRNCCLTIIAAKYTSCSHIYFSYVL